MEALRNSSPALVGRALSGPVRYAQIPQLAERGLSRVDDFFATLERRLVDRKFIATDRFSVVDITAAVTVDFARAVHRVPGTELPHLLRWRAAMGQRTSFSL
jgi:glutathione S-transferase